MKMEDMILVSVDDHLIEPPDTFTNTKGIRMVKLEGGKFRMGSPQGEVGRRPDEGPQNEVTIRGPLLMSATEVSHTQFLQVMKTSPAKSATHEYA